ncbi:MAG TPA: HPr kinase/phosphatase C-terminal domain-containing protein [Rhizomicrobium sp.]|nr:HPr kinase/phosphatase C-terminal domain-containing protein [Rhizomicrobium sp.]
MKPANVKTANIHASCALIGRHGVLILGESGQGKSDLLLRLMDEGGKLVADDRTELYAAKGRLCARAPKSIAGLIEVRGLGIVAQPFAKKAVLALAVRLGDSAERLPEPAFFQPPEGLGRTKAILLMVLDGTAASAPARLRLALKAVTKGLIREGFNPSGTNPK